MAAKNFHTFNFDHHHGFSMKILNCKNFLNCGIYMNMLKVANKLSIKLYE